MSIVIIHGPKASGKTTNAEQFKRLYKCKRIIDGWGDFGVNRVLRDGDMVLTNMEPPFDGVVIPHSAVVVDIETAKRAIGWIKKQEKTK